MLAKFIRLGVDHTSYVWKSLIASIFLVIDRHSITSMVVYFEAVGAIPRPGIRFPLVTDGQILVVGWLSAPTIFIQIRVGTGQSFLYRWLVRIHNYYFKYEKN